MTHMEVAGGYVKQNGSCQGGHGMAGQNYCVVIFKLLFKKYDMEYGMGLSGTG